ncbi:MAG: tripartite tricarboxylate transporter TctB family protein [Thermodesulfobacteriota bacterium]
MKTQRVADLVVGLVLAAVGLGIIIAAFQIEAAFAEKLPPRTLPVVMGVLLIVTGLLLSFRAWQYQGPAVLIEWPDRGGWGRLAISYAAFCLYLVLISPLGFPLATLLYLSFHIWFLEKKIGRAAIVGLATSVLILFVFIRFLGLAFPVGPLSW